MSHAADFLYHVCIGMVLSWVTLSITIHVLSKLISL